MKKSFLTTLIPHVIAIAIFIIIPYIYFSPLIEGKEIQQHDKTTYLGGAKEIIDFREATGEEALWTNSLFGGMPAYLISTMYPSNLVKYINQLLQFIQRPVNQLFVCLLGFYISLLIFGVNPWLSILGAIAFAFSSYFFIIISAGHNSKAFAIAFMSPIIAGTYLAYRGRILMGSAIMALFLSLHLIANHLQITYYTFIILLLFGLVELVYAIKQKEYQNFFKATAILILTAILAIGSNFSSLWNTYEYGKYSIRGKSELTHNEANQTSGLDKDYATGWSYGKAETGTLLIPNFKGGASGAEVGKNSASFEFFKKLQGEKYALQVIKQLPMYWGDQPGTSGPVYFGAIIMFLFVLGIFIVDPKLKWWLISATIVSVLLSWGHNFSWLTNFFLDYIPGYNKFRTVSMILVIAQFTVPLMAILALKKIFDGSLEKQKLEKSFKNSLYIIGGICLFFVLLPGLFFDFSAPGDQRYIAQGGQDFVNALMQDRKMMLRNDAFRSLIFILLSAGSIYLYMKNRLKLTYTLGALCLLVLIDMWGVDRRYLNDDNFVSKKQAREPFQMTQADQQILADKDPNFRVFNVTVDPFNDASTSYFHKSIGGYHGAKMRRYQELIEQQIAKNNMEVLNMLNTKYFIVPGSDKQPMAQYNPEALGNAWFVHDFRIVENADAEMEALNNFASQNEAIINKQFSEFVAGKDFVKDSAAVIKLNSYKPNHLVYTVNCTSEQLAVFSEIYYPKGWNVYIDGLQNEYFSANYVLRAMVIPAGEHTIEFKFEPRSYHLGNKISLASSSILLILLLFVLGKELIGFYKKNND